MSNTDSTRDERLLSLPAYDRDEAHGYVDAVVTLADDLERLAQDTVDCKDRPLLPYKIRDDARPIRTALGQSSAIPCNASCEPDPEVETTA